MVLYIYNSCSSKPEIVTENAMETMREIYADCLQDEEVVNDGDYTFIDEHRAQVCYGNDYLYMELVG